MALPIVATVIGTAVGAIITEILKDSPPPPPSENSKPPSENSKKSNVVHELRGS
ncbi:MAG: hypothetical protein ACKOQS_19710 [Dolichospermum sp.]